MKSLLAVAFRPAGAAIVLTSVLAVVVLVVASSELTGTFAAIAGIWLAIHHVPLPIDGVTLGVAPLTASALLLWAVARGVHRAVGEDGAVTEGTETRDLLRVAGAAVVGPLVVTCAALAIVADASSVVALSTPNPLAALAWTAVLHALAAGVGITVARWPHWSARVPFWVRDGARPAGRALAGFAAAGSFALAVSLVWHWTTVGELFDTSDGAVGAAGLAFVSILYLPNAVVSAAATLVGANATFGDVSVSVWGNIGGRLPALPLFGAVPEGVGGAAWPALLVVPAAVGVLCGRDASVRHSGQRALAVVGGAALGAGVVAALAAVLAGGALGGYGTVDVHWWAFGGLVGAWLAVVGAFTVVVLTWFRGRHAVDEPAEQPDAPGERTAEPIPALAAAHGDPEPIDTPGLVGAPVPDGAHGEADTDETDTDTVDDILDAEVVEEPAESRPAGAGDLADGPSKPQD
ncbi:hypothetical protein HCA44_07205 [Rhodococcus sp. HNM0569]|nr:hypothetical protein [Rhodococcus sp. HNM0569]